MSISPVSTEIEIPAYFVEEYPISIDIEIPEKLHDSVVRFTESSDWSYNDVVQESLKLFLLSQNKGDRVEMILCPNCGSHESAVVETTEIFDSYVHFCSECGYTITESEWEKV